MTYTKEEVIKAQQETIDSLKRKVVKLYNSGGASGFISALESAKKRREIMEIKNKELAKYNETLESEVAKRTAAIKAIVNNVTFGFLLVKEDLKVQHECTKSCFDIFDNQYIEGKKFSEVLQLKGRDAENFNTFLEQVYEDIIPSEDSIEQVPSIFHLNEKVIQADGKVIRGGDGEVESVMFSISDITELIKQEEENRNNQKIIRILQHIDLFKKYIEDAKEIIRQCESCIKNKNEVSLRRNLHTLKGMSSSFSLEDLVKLIHELEEKDDIILEDLKKAGSCLSEFLQVNYSTLNIKPEQSLDETFIVSLNHLEELKHLSNKLPVNEQANLNRWIDTLTVKPVFQLVEPLKEFTKSLAERLGKQVHLNVGGENVYVRYDNMKGLFNNITHMIRNSVDHGIEFPSQRREKPKESPLNLTFSKISDSLVIKLSDDGKGLDKTRILSAALNKGTINSIDETKGWSDSKIFNLIFEDGLSTADSKTDISGQGVGMSSILDVVKKQNGKIEIESQEGKGTTVSITVPLVSADSYSMAS